MPTGVLNAAGINAEAVDGQTGEALFESILKACNRLAQKFEKPDTCVIAPRDLVRVDLAKASGSGAYLFEGGLAQHLPSGVDLVVDGNVPTSLGAGSNESAVIVGNFRRGLYYFNRQAPTLDSSRFPGRQEDLTSFRGVVR